MNRIIYKKIIVCIFIILEGCNALKHSNKNIIHGVSFNTSFPDVFNKEGKITGYIPIQRNVYFYNDQIMYYGSNVTDSIVNGKILSSRPVFYHFVYTEGHLYGHYYNDAFKQYGARLPVDSFLNDEAAYYPYKYPFYDSSFIKRNGKLISQQYNKDSSTLNQIFTLKGGRPGVQAADVYDSLYLTFSKNFMKTKYTLSRQFENVTKMKLIKAVFIYNPIYYKDQDYTFEKMISPYILEEINIDNADELMKYFDEDKRKNAEEEKRK